MGGLEIVYPDERITAADPVPGAMLVLAGHALQRWTSDTVKAVVHIVPFPRDETMRKTTRQSCGFFIQPDCDCVIKCLDGSNAYEPITSEENEPRREITGFLHMRKQKRRSASR